MPVFEDALVLIGSLTGFAGFSHDPLKLILAVNDLYSFGSESAFRTLQEYSLRCAHNRELRLDNALLCARVLFVPKDSRMPLPRLSLGVPDVPEPDDPAWFPLFPLCLWSDVPFLLTAGYRVGGEAESPLQYLDWLKRNGQLRTAPLRPDNDPLRVIDQMLASRSWQDLQLEPWHDSMLRLQALRTVSHAYSTNLPEERPLQLNESSGESWDRHRKAFEARHIVWNAMSKQYEQAEQ